MSQRKILNTLVFALAAILFSGIHVNGQTYSGQGFAGSVKVDVFGQPVVTSNVLDTGDIPSNGIGGAGTITQTSLGNYTLPGGVLQLGDRTVTATAPTGGNSSTSFASVNSLNVGALSASNLVTAGVITASTSAVCPNEVLTGSSTIASLTVAGNPITVTGDPNQLVEVTVPGVASVRVVINEQIIHPRSITVNALHITITALDNLTTIDVIVTSARSGINCGAAPTSDLYSGRGTAVRVHQNSLVIPFLSTIVADTGWLPSPGTAPDPPITSTTNGAGVLPPLLTTSTAFSSTEGGSPAGTTESSSQVEDLDILIGPATVLGPNLLSITADAVESNTQCQCSLGAPTCTGDSDLAALTVAVLGVPLLNIPLDFPPNFTLVNLDLPGILTLVVTVNEQESTSLGTYQDITVNALHVELGVIASLLIDTDIKVAHSHSDIACALAPSAAPVYMNGRVLNLSGRPISRAVVTLMDESGNARTTMTSSLGYYSFEDVPSGESYLLATSARGYTFATRLVSLGDNVSNFNIYPEVSRTENVAPVSTDATKEVVKEATPARKSESVFYRYRPVFTVFDPDPDSESEPESKILQ